MQKHSVRGPSPRSSRPLAALLVSLLLPAILALSACSLRADHADWATFVIFHGIQYLAVDTGDSTRGRAPTEADVGPVYATVTRNAEDAGLGPGDPLQDGDASTLPVGTPVYRFNGYAPTFRLIAHLEGRPEQRPLLRSHLEPTGARGEPICSTLAAG